MKIIIAVIISLVFTACHKHVKEVMAEDGYFSKNFDVSLCSFYDKFEGDSLDLTKWSYQNGNGGAYGVPGWGNREMQSYHPDQVTVKDGILRLEAKRLERGYFDGKFYVSGKIVTANGGTNGALLEPPENAGTKFAQVYGRFEAKIRMSKAASGIWPAFWMMPLESVYGGWPLSGEIDIMEMIGQRPDRASSTIHLAMRDGSRQAKYFGTEYNFPGGSDMTSWHVFGLHWTEDEMIFLIDGKRIRNISHATWRTSFYRNNEHSMNAPFDRPFHFILNVALDSGHFNKSSSLQDGDLPVAMEVEWVRAYTLENNPWPVPQENINIIQNYTN